MRSDIKLILLMSLVLSFSNWNCSFLSHRVCCAGVSCIRPGAIFYADTKEKLIAITIDDGPDSSSTRKILKVLEEHDSKATFFLITNNIRDNERIVTQIVKNGHELGNHMTHDECSYKLKKTEFVSKFNEADSILSLYSKIRWFRPGSGFYNNFMIKYLKQDRRGYSCVIASVYPLDNIIPSSSFASTFISLNVRSGSILVLHDRGKRGIRTAKTLKKILPNLKKRGYKIVTLSELFDSHSK